MPKTTKKSKPAVKKTVTKSKPEPTVEQIIAEQVQQQLQEALLNIEIEVPQQNTDAFVDMDLLRDEIKKQVEFETRKTSYKTTNERIVASREVKALILDINEIYKESKDAELMDLMKRLTVIKRKIEKRLKGRPGS